MMMVGGGDGDGDDGDDGMGFLRMFVDPQRVVRRLENEKKKKRKENDTYHFMFFSGRKEVNDKNVRSALSNRVFCADRSVLCLYQSLQ